MIRSASPAVWLAVLALSSFSPQPASAQNATLLRDIFAAEELGSSTVSLGSLTAAGGKLFFLARLQNAGEEVWVSDGSSAGTEMLRDSCPGTCSQNPQFFGALAGSLLWSESDLEGRKQLWASNGTRPGTVALTEAPTDLIRAVNSPGTQTAFLSGAFYFVSCRQGDSGEDCDLARTEGTVASTQIAHAAPRSFAWLAPAADRLFYLTSDGQDWDLWTLSRAQPAPLLLRSFDSSLGDRPRVPIAVGGRLYFVAQDADGEEVWTSDGTAAGTRVATRLATPRPFIPWLKAAGNRVYFFASEGAVERELWRTDGTPESTVRLSNFPRNDPFEEDSPTKMAAIGDRVLFAAIDPPGARQLWTSRGTPATTAALSLACTDCELSASDFVVSEGKAYFFLYEDSWPSLWVTDGTAAGTRSLLPACTSGRCYLGLPKPWKNGVLFTVKRSFYPEIWFSDGTVAGTGQWVQLDEAEEEPNLQIAELGGGTFFLSNGEDADGLWVRDSSGAARPVALLPRSRPSSSPHSLLALGDRILFAARHADFYEQGLWTSLGSPDTTLQIDRPSLTLDSQTRLLRVGGLAYFQTGLGFRNLWRSDGTESGTFVAAHLQESAPMASLGGGLVFFDAGWIWRSDGTVAGTVKTGDLPFDLYDPSGLVEGPGGLYFIASTDSHSGAVWITDGTTSGTRRLTDFEGSGFFGSAAELTVLGSFVYFVGPGGIWRTDGTTLGTVNVVPFGSSEVASGLTAFQGNLFYFRRSSRFSDAEFRLWRTDGTPAGTTQLASFASKDRFDAAAGRLTVLGGRAFFVMDDGVHGRELWSTDGTAAGTTLARDVMPGLGSSNPTGLTVAGGNLYFAAGDTVHGIELWRSDGTAAGTRLAQDIAPQANSSFPSDLTVAGDKLYFSADDGLNGREPWVLPLSGGAACRASSTRLCLANGRYSVESTWRDHQGNEGAGHPVSLTADTGYFWFFDPSNVETVLKVLDGRGVNGHVWTFYGALSDVEYSLTVTDTETGLAHRYLNPPGQLASVGDTHSFGPLGASAASVTTVTKGAGASAPLALMDRRVVARAATGACAPSSDRLCLNGGRYAVEVAWKDFAGNTGVGQAVGLTADTGYFWFFNAANVELVLKVLDGSAVNGHRWVFYGALSSVEYTVTVTDTETGEIKTYRNPSGSLASVADIEAF